MKAAFIESVFSEFFRDLAMALKDLHIIFLETACDSLPKCSVLYLKLKPLLLIIQKELYSSTVRLDSALQLRLIRNSIGNCSCAILLPTFLFCVFHTTASALCLMNILLF